jgi:hypothetical protein
MPQVIHAVVWVQENIYEYLRKMLELYVYAIEALLDYMKYGNHAKVLFVWSLFLGEVQCRVHNLVK